MRYDARDRAREQRAQTGGFVGYIDARTVSRTGCRRAASAGSRTFARSGSTLDGVERACGRRRALASSISSSTRRQVTAGSFVFVLSDFLDPPSRETWLTAVEHLWDVIPVVIQDPIWEQSFPDVSGIVVPLRDPRTGRVTHVRLTKKEAAARKQAHEERLAALLDELALLDLDPRLISSSEPSEVLASFLDWTEFRRARRGVMGLT